MQDGLAAFVCVFLVLLSGQSSVDVIFNIVEAHEGAHSDFSLKEGRPLTGQWKRQTFKLSHFLQILVFGWQTYLLQSLLLSLSLSPWTQVEISAPSSLWQEVTQWASLKSPSWTEQGKRRSTDRCRCKFRLIAVWSSKLSDKHGCSHSPLWTHPVFSAQSLGDSNFLATFSNVPAGDFVIRFRGEEGSATSRTSAGSSNIQRQVPTRIRTSSISVTVSKIRTSVFYMDVGLLERDGALMF